MGNNNSQAIELDIKDILLFTLKKTHIVIIVGIIFTVLAGGYKYYKSLKASIDVAPKTNVLDTDTRISGESDEEYEQRILLVNRAENLIANIAVLNSQNDNLRNYISNSLLMQLDPMNVSVSEAQLIITLNEGESYDMINALADSYSNVVETGEYISDIAQEYDYVPGSLQELISVGYVKNKYDVILDSDDVSSLVLKIKIWGDSPELTEAVLDGALSEINEKNSEFNSSIAKHTITEIGRQNYVSFISAVRDLQLETMTVYQALQSQIDSGNKYLDDIAKQLGLTDRNSFFADDSSQSVPTTISKSSILKAAALGFIIGAAIVITVYACKYIFGRKLLTQTQFSCLFPSTRSIGVLKPASKRNKLQAAIDRASGDDFVFSADNAFALVSANCRNLTKDMSRVLVTGTIDNDSIKKIAEDIGIPCDIKLDIFNHPEILNTLGDYDGVVIIEQRGVSEKKRIGKELELLNNGAKAIVGTIIV